MDFKSIEIDCISRDFSYNDYLDYVKRANKTDVVEQHVYNLLKEEFNKKLEEDLLGSKL